MPSQKLAPGPVLRVLGREEICVIHQLGEQGSQSAELSGARVRTARLTGRAIWRRGRARFAAEVPRMAPSAVLFLLHHVFMASREPGIVRWNRHLLHDDEVQAARVGAGVGALEGIGPVGR